MNIDISKAHAYVVVSNYANDPSYCPYCMRCSGLHRMKLVEPYLWRHHCGAVHDERQVITSEPQSAEVPHD